MDESARNQDFFKIITLSKKKENIKPYTKIRIKSRNFLSNISYVGVNKEDFYNKGFLFDVYSLIVKNLNPCSLERKTSDQNKQEIIYMLWKECVPLEVYKYSLWQFKELFQCVYSCAYSDIYCSTELPPPPPPPSFNSAEVNTKSQTNSYPKPVNDAFWRNDNDKKRI